MARSDGSVIGATRLTSNGFPAWNIVILGDGYQRRELETYRTDVQKFVDTFFATWPYAGLRRAIDVFRVDVVSIDSWAAGRRSYFDTTIRFQGPEVLAGNSAAVLSTLDEVVPCWDVAIVLVNSTVYRGAGDPRHKIIYCSRASGAQEIILHQLGHAGFGLGDEYCHSGGGQGPGRESHPLFEPASANVTVMTSPVKWARYVTASPTPKTSNPDCRACDPQPNPFAAGTVGLFEGAATYPCRAYRPQYDCRMRTLGQPYCAVCQDRILASLVERLPTTLVACRSTGWVMDVAGASRRDNAVVRQAPPQNTLSQRVRLEPRVGGFYRVQTGQRASSSGRPILLVLDIAGASMSPGGSIQQYAQNGGANQEFQLDPLGDAYFRIIARHSGLVVEVADGSAHTGVPLQQAVWTGGANQQWIPFVETQSDWRQCRKCAGLFFGGGPHTVCPAGGSHAGTDAAAYSLGRDMPSLAGWEDNWRSCCRCQGLFFGGTSGSVCPLSGSHVASAIASYSLPLTVAPWRDASRWRQCRRCQGLYRSGTRHPCCPAGGAHQARGTVTYSLMLG